MNVKLTPHAAELLAAVRTQCDEPAEVIVEHALELFIHDQHINVQQPWSRDIQAQGVREMLDFVKQNRVRLGPGASVKDFIHEGHRV